MKRNVLAVILAGMVLSLAACGGNTGAAGSDAQTQTEETGPESGPEGETQTSPEGPESTEITDVEGAGADGPVIENPEETGDGPQVTDETADPNAVPGSGTAQGEEEEADVWTIEGAGLMFTPPEEFNNIDGMILERGGGETVEGSGVTYYSISYIGITPDDYNAFQEKAASEEPSDEEIDRLRKAYRDLFTVYSIDGGRTEEDLRTYLEASGLGDVKLEQLEEDVEGYAFFFSDEASLEKSEELGEFEEEFKTLAGLMDTYKANIFCTEPLPMEQ